jgi:hypothetical protein
MGKWLDLAARLEADVRDNRDNRDESPRFGAYVPNVPNVPASLPPSVTIGLNRLSKMAAPPLQRPEAWPLVVSDALGLARNGWAAKALALGWSPLDLFGAVTDRGGYADADGLAVWLEGRPVLAISDTYASVGDGGGRAYFNRSTRLGTTLLWDIGR